MHFCCDCAAPHVTCPVKFTQIIPSFTVTGYHIGASSLWLWGPAWDSHCYGYRVYFVSYGGWLPYWWIFFVIGGPCTRHILWQLQKQWVQYISICVFNKPSIIKSKISSCHNCCHMHYFNVRAYATMTSGTSFATKCPCLMQNVQAESENDTWKSKPRTIVKWRLESQHWWVTGKSERRFQKADLKGKRRWEPTLGALAILR